MVQPDVALFGQKDFQQLMVIRHMANDLCIPVEIIGVPTVREEDGLAMSSRNGYLTAEERKQAPELYRIMQETAKSILSGEQDYAGLERKSRQALEKSGFSPDYYYVRRANDLSEPNAADQSLVIVAAAYLGKARLIDNLQVSVAGS
jgi:pantoate--beta-alanine ligase